MAILGFSHLCVTCASIDLVASLEQFGYKTKFIAGDLCSPPQKYPFQRHPGAIHDIRFLTHSKGNSIEAVCHQGNSFLVGEGYYPVFFTSSDISIDKRKHQGVELSIVSNAFGKPVSERVFELSGRIYYSVPGQDTGLGAFVCRTADMDASIEFWGHALGFKEVGSSPSKNWVMMKFAGMVKTFGTRLLLVQSSDPPEPAYIDDVGCPCLSFLTRSIDESIKALERHGVKDIGEVFNMDIGGQRLQIVFLRGLNGELTEFIQLT